jgi:hypothetical protein
VYLYNIKIQTNINQNKVKNLRKITYFFEIIFEENFFQAGLDPAGLIGSLAQVNNPAGQIRGTRKLHHACMQQLLFK